MSVVFMKRNKSRIFERADRKCVVSYQRLIGNPAPSGLVA